MELLTPYEIHDTDNVDFVSVVDCNGLWVFDCYRHDAREIVKRINAKGGFNAQK